MTGVAALARRSLDFHSLRPAISVSSIPFLLTFLVVALFAWKRLFPLLSGRKQSHSADGLPVRRDSFSSFKFSRTSLSISKWTTFAVERAAAITFSTTIALSTVLAELIFCEISNIVNPAARALALEATITVLLVSLIIVTPALEIHSITSAIGLVGSGGRARLCLGLIFDILGLAAWLVSFWWIGEAVLGDSRTRAQHGLSKGSLERIGIIGISLMASLAGFAAISSIWQTFGVRGRKVAEAELARKKIGLETTTDLLAVKESRLRALERKLSDVPQGSFFTRVVGSFRGNPDTYELSALRMEISGLETMQTTLSNSLSLLRSRYSAQQQATTTYGRMCLSASYLFAFYCLYRIGAASSAVLRRWWSPNTSVASSDPINIALTLIAKHWDPSIDRAAWSRTFSFLLSGIMLLASFNAVLQTVLLFSRFTPTKLLQSAQQNLALLVSQISATYVVSSALLLRSNLPSEMGISIEGAFGGAPLDPAFVERWFEAWFLGACAITGIGIWVGKTFVGPGELDDDYFEEGDLESGKRRS